jgi:hypothetical protein
VTRSRALSRAELAAEAAAGAASRTARRAVASPSAARLERFGYAVRGFVYVVVGVLALGLVVEGVTGATRASGAPDGRAPTPGAMYAIGALPLGPALLVMTAAGLACYGAWGLTRAFLDPLSGGHRPADLLRRAGYLASGWAYFALVPPTVQLALGARDGWAVQAGPLGPRQLEWANGNPWLIGAAGVWLASAAAGDLYQVWTGAFRHDYAAWRMTPPERGLVALAGRAGLAARGTVFALLGAFLLAAAPRAGAAGAGDLGDLGAAFVVRALVAQRLGVLPAALLATGLICFGVYSLCCARWCRLSSRDAAPG